MLQEEDEKGALGMTSWYQVTLHSPMGPREGTLRLTLSESGVTGTLFLLGMENPVAGEQVRACEFYLTHHLHSILSDLSCRSHLVVSQGVLTGEVETEKGCMRLTGVRLEGT